MPLALSILCSMHEVFSHWDINAVQVSRNGTTVASLSTSHSNVETQKESGVHLARKMQRRVVC